MNYLTTPHVIIWSAVVASCSIPGVWEPQRLLVKDVDGVVRFESPSDEGGASRYSDGSMEQDLPMQQLSEMFNVNHFIVSQANPHAVMFASFTHLKRKAPLGFLLNPLLTGMCSSVLTFLKHRCRSWMHHVVQMISKQRSVPQHATSRILFSRFFIQNYEGRDSCDISLIPWINHCSLLRTMQYVLYNPNEEDFRSWSDAAERETWKFLPAIKSHVAEEVTLERCVQRLRHRIIREGATSSSALMDENVVLNTKQQYLRMTLRDNTTRLKTKNAVEKSTTMELDTDEQYPGGSCSPDSTNNTNSSKSGNGNNKMTVRRPFQGQQNLPHQPAGLATGAQ
jgi:predicted acylesterase/phospholipase RssA